MRGYPQLSTILCNWFEWLYKRGQIRKGYTGWDFRMRPLTVAVARSTGLSYEKIMYGGFAETKKL